MVWHVIIALTQAAASQVGQSASSSATLNLVCIGTASKDERVGTTFDFLSGGAHTERVGETDSLKIQINPDSTGTARMPRRLYSYAEPNPDGSFPLLGVVRGQDEITGKVRLNANYKPSFRLDRISGVVTFNGLLGDFSGRCEAYDPATVKRKF